MKVYYHNLPLGGSRFPANMFLLCNLQDIVNAAEEDLKTLATSINPEGLKSQLWKMPVAFMSVPVLNMMDTLRLTVNFYCLAFSKKAN